MKFSAAVPRGTPSDVSLLLRSGRPRLPARPPARRLTGSIGFVDRLHAAAGDLRDRTIDAASTEAVRRCGNLEEYAHDPEVTRFLAWRPHRSIADTIAFLETVETHWRSGRRFGWALTRPGQDRVIGMLGCGIRAHQAGLGYVLGRKHWRHGLMAEAVSAILGWLIEHSAIYRVWAVCDTTHLASARVLEKVGLEREGVLRRLIIHPNISAEPKDCYCYSRVRGSSPSPPSL